jgi:hypothetical protein
MAPEVQARRVDDGINGFIVIIIKFWSVFARSLKWDCHKKRKSKECNGGLLQKDVSEKFDFHVALRHHQS